MPYVPEQLADDYFSAVLPLVLALLTARGKVSAEGRSAPASGQEWTVMADERAYRVGSSLWLLWALTAAFPAVPLALALAVLWFDRGNLRSEPSAREVLAGCAPGPVVFQIGQVQARAHVAPGDRAPSARGRAGRLAG